MASSLEPGLRVFHKFQYTSFALSNCSSLHFIDNEVPTSELQDRLWKISLSICPVKNFMVEKIQRKKNMEEHSNYATIGINEIKGNE